MGPPRKAKERVLRQLQSRKNREYHHSDENLHEGSNCVICLDKIECRGVISVCPHWFCFYCIYEWSKKTNTCPLCKARFRCIIKITVGNRAAPPQRFRIKDKDQSIVVFADDDYEVAMGLNEESTTSESEIDMDESFRPSGSIRPVTARQVNLRPRRSSQENHVTVDMGHENVSVSSSFTESTNVSNVAEDEPIQPELSELQEHNVEPGTDQEFMSEESTAVGQENVDNSDADGENLEDLKPDEECSENDSDPDMRTRDYQPSGSQMRRKRKRKSILYQRTPLAKRRTQSTLHGWIDMSFKCRRSSRITRKPLLPMLSSGQRQAKLRGIKRMRENRSEMYYHSPAGTSSRSSTTRRKTLRPQIKSRQNVLDSDAETESEIETHSRTKKKRPNEVDRQSESESDDQNNVNSSVIDNLSGSGCKHTTRRQSQRNISRKVYIESENESGNESDTSYKTNTPEVVEAVSETDVENESASDISRNNLSAEEPSLANSSVTAKQRHKAQQIISSTDDDTDTTESDVLDGEDSDDDNKENFRLNKLIRDGKNRKTHSQLTNRMLFSLKPTLCNMKKQMKVGVRNNLKQYEASVSNTSSISINSDDLAIMSGVAQEDVLNNDELSPCILSQTFRQSSRIFKQHNNNKCNMTNNIKTSASSTRRDVADQLISPISAPSTEIFPSPAITTLHLNNRNSTRFGTGKYKFRRIKSPNKQRYSSNVIENPSSSSFIVTTPEKYWGRRI